MAVVPIFGFVLIYDDNANVRSAPIEGAADNTKINERDSKGTTLTPGDQSENETDRTITQQIRQEVVKADDLSTDGKNVKIITVDGVVTLRGPVQTAAERKEIASVAQKGCNVSTINWRLQPNSCVGELI